MAVLHIQEYEYIAKTGTGETLSAGFEPAVASQALTFTTTAASAAFNTRTKFVRLVSSAAVYLEFATSPTSVVTDMLLPANTVGFFAVVPGQKVSAYDGSS